MAKPFILPGQPIRYPRSRNFNIVHSKLEFDLDFETKSFTGKVAHNVEPIIGFINSVEFDAVGLNFKSVQVNGKDAKHETREKSIVVDLGFDLAPGSRADVELQYSLTPVRGLYFRGPTKDYPDRRPHAFTQGQSEDSKYWYPCYDYPNMRTTTETVITAPENMVAVSNGKLVSVSEPSGGRKTWHFRQEIGHVSYLVSLVVGEFTKIEETHNDILMQYLVPPGREGEAARSFAKTAKMIDFFSEYTGEKYPYPKYAQSTVADFMYGGMENISATTLTELTLHDERSHIDYTSDSLVAHELAHQWFGDLLTCKDWSNAWLNEGFATYFDALFKEHDMGVDEFQYLMYWPTIEYIIEELDRYQRGIVCKYYWDADELFDYHTYYKGSWVLNGLRGLLGDDVFRKGIRRYVAANKGSVVETSDFRKALEDVSGMELESFFEQWLYSPGFPDYAAEYSWDSSQKMARLEIEQTNAGSDGVPLFTMPLELRFTFQNGKVSKKIRMEQKKQVFFFALDEAPLNVNIDPRNWVLKHLKFKKPKEMHIHQLRNDDNAMEKVRACTELASFPTDDVVNVLAAAVDSDGFWGVQLEAAKALGKIGTKSALNALIERKNHPDHKTRRGIAYGLRGFANIDKAEDAIDALIGILENDKAYYTRAYAAWSLGFYKNSEKAYEAAKKAMDQDSYNDMVRYRALQGFADRGDSRALALSIEYLLHGKHFRGRMAAAYAVGKLGKGDAKAAEALFAIRNDPDVHVRSESALSVQLLGDSSTVPQLESWLALEPEGRVRRSLRESIHELKEKTGATEEAPKLQAQVEKLAEQEKLTEARLAALEAKP